MKIIEKDILTVEKGIICQQVNCQGVMGSGLAKSIREKWPIVYKSYLATCKTYQPNFVLLGQHNLTGVTDDLYVANIWGQLNYGYDGERYTDYGALRMAFSRMRDGLAGDERDIYFPFNFGCDRGGADWNIVSKMIEFYLPNAIICKLPQRG